MLEHDLEPVMAIENAVYPHPWTRGNFKDSLRDGYHCWVMEAGGDSIGYGVMMVAAGGMFLEVRPTNVAGLGLYADAGFIEIAIRRGYYPARAGREDAIVMHM